MSIDKTVDIEAKGGATESDITGSPGVGGLPAVLPGTAVVAARTSLPTPEIKRGKRHWLKPTLLLLVLLLGAAGGGYWWLRPRSALPPGFAWGNGRLEADEIDIDTKYAARIAKLFVDEGDLTKAGEIVAKMDTQDLDASLKKSQALIVQAQKTLAAAEATLEQQKSQVLLARQEIARTQALVAKGYATRETLDQQGQVLSSAVAGQTAATDVIGESQAAIEAASHDVELYQVEIADDSLAAPRDGRIEYRVANVGEVLPAGGKVFTMLDGGYVYMDVYLPTLSAGRVKPGSDARIVLDSYPTYPLPAKVVFVAAQAQFTPKTVETNDERDVLMFRVRVRINPDVLAAHAGDVRSGLPGVAYVQTAPDVVWPASLLGAARK